MEPPVVILVHGAWHGPWAWADVIERLSGEGIRTVALDLPSKGSDTAPSATCTATLRSCEQRSPTPGRPRSSSPTPTAGCRSARARPTQRTSSTSPRSCSSRASRCSASGAGSIRTGGSPRTTAASCVPDDPKHVFYADCPADVAERAAAALVPQNKDVFRQELRSAAWRTVPSTYVVCGRDNAIPPALQELMSQRAGTVSHMDASHSPFLSRPGEVTAIIQETLAAVVAEA